MVFWGFVSSASNCFKPQDPCNPLVVHPLSSAGEELESKLTRLREAIQRQGARCILLKLGEEDGGFLLQEYKTCCKDNG